MLNTTVATQSEYNLNLCAHACKRLLDRVAGRTTYTYSSYPTIEKGLCERTNRSDISSHADKHAAGRAVNRPLLLDVCEGVLPLLMRALAIAKCEAQECQRLG